MWADIKITKSGKNIFNFYFYTFSVAKEYEGQSMKDFQ